MLVLDANILIRAVLGSRVLSLLRKYEGCVELYAPDLAFAEAREVLPAIVERRGLVLATILKALDSLSTLVAHRRARVLRAARIARPATTRPPDPDDWPALASALLLRCPIWTEDTDFFGCGVATWTTQTVELYLAESIL